VEAGREQAALLTLLDKSTQSLQARMVLQILEAEAVGQEMLVTLAQTTRAKAAVASSS